MSHEFLMAPNAQNLSTFAVACYVTTIVNTAIIACTVHHPIQRTPPHRDQHRVQGSSHHTGVIIPYRGHHPIQETSLHTENVIPYREHYLI